MTNEQMIKHLRPVARSLITPDDVRRQRRVDGVIGNDGRLIERPKFDATWNDNNPLRLGDYHLWIDSSGNPRFKNGKATSDTDGTLFNELPTFDAAWNGTRKLRLGSYHLWVDPDGDLRMKGSTASSAYDGVIVGEQTNDV